MQSQDELSRIEKEIQTVYQSVQPSEAFRTNLRARIVERTGSGVSSGNENHPRPWRLSLGMRFAIGFALALLVLVFIFVLDTPSFLAKARAFFRFIPGIGFVEDTNARMLCAPVEVQEGDLNVKILAAGGSGRDLHFSFSATYPSGERQIGYVLFDDAGNKAEMRGGGGGGGGGDGGPITMNGSGDFLLPSDSNSLVMVINQSLPNGDLLGEVRIPIQLCPANEENGGQKTAPGDQEGNQPAAAASPDYAPAGVADTHDGITLRILQVSQNEKGTGIQIQAVLDPDGEILGNIGNGSVWVHPYGMLARNLFLTDDTGREYALQDAPLMNDLRDPSLSSHQFDPLAKEARRATLKVQEVAVLLEDKSVPFTFDPGGKPTLGQVWNQSQLTERAYNLDGFELTFLEASYDKSRQQINAETFSDMYTLTFKVKVKPPAPKMTLACMRINFVNAMTECGWSVEDEALILRTSFMEELDERVLNGNLDNVSMNVAGPWNLTWDLPE